MHFVTMFAPHIERLHRHDLDRRDSQFEKVRNFFDHGHERSWMRHPG